MRGGRGTERGRREGAAAAAAPDRPRAWTALPPGARAIAAFRSPCRPPVQRVRPAPLSGPCTTSSASSNAAACSGFARRPFPAPWHLPSNRTSHSILWAPPGPGSLPMRAVDHPSACAASCRRGRLSGERTITASPFVRRRRRRRRRTHFRLLPACCRLRMPRTPSPPLVSEPRRAVHLFRGGGAALRARTRCAALWPAGLSLRREAAACGHARPHPRSTPRAHPCARRSPPHRRRRFPTPCPSCTCAAPLWPARRQHSSKRPASAGRCQPFRRTKRSSRL